MSYVIYGLTIASCLLGVMAISQVNPGNIFYTSISKLIAHSISTLFLIVPIYLITQYYNHFTFLVLIYITAIFILSFAWSFLLNKVFATNIKKKLLETIRSRSAYDLVDAEDIKCAICGHKHLINQIIICTDCLSTFCRHCLAQAANLHNRSVCPKCETKNSFLVAWAHVYPFIRDNVKSSLG